MALFALSAVPESCNSETQARGGSEIGVAAPVASSAGTDWYSREAAVVMTPGTPLFCCPTLRPPSQERIRPDSHLEHAPRSSGTGASATGLEVGQEVRMHIDRRHRGNLRSQFFEHSNHCSAVIETSEPGGRLIKGRPCDPTKHHSRSVE